MSIESLKNKRNELIYQLWVTLNELTRVEGSLDNDDKNLYFEVNTHYAVRSKLSGSKKNV